MNNSSSSSEDEEDLIYSRTIRESDKRTPIRLYLLTTLSAMGGFLFGYDTGVVSGAMILVRSQFGLSEVWHEIVVGATVASAFGFALVAGALSNNFGRKPAILASSVAFVVGSFFLGLAPGKWTLLFGRIIVGIGIGITSASVPIYIAETVPAKTRGSLVTLNNAFITGGQFTAAIVAGLFSGSPEGWRPMFGLAAIPACLQFFGFAAMPETPRYLVKKGKFEEAAIVLSQIRKAHDNVSEELEDIKLSTFTTRIDPTGGDDDEGEDYSNQTQLAIIKDVLKTPSVRKALILGCLLQFFQQMSGINTVMYYSASIIEMAGIRNHGAAIWLAALTAGVNFFATFIGLYLVDRKGRRHLLFSSLIGVIFSLIFMSFSFRLMTAFSPPVTLNSCSSSTISISSCSDCISVAQCGFCQHSTNTSGICLPLESARSCSVEINNDWCPTAFSWLAVLGLCLYLLAFAPGMGPLPWTINSEIYPLWARSTCTGVATSVNWSANLIVSMSFLSVVRALGKDGAFFFYGLVSALGLIIFYFKLPETRGISLEEVDNVFKQKSVRRDTLYSRISNPLED